MLLLLRTNNCNADNDCHKGPRYQSALIILTKQIKFVKMARSTKRAAPTAASQRPAKKRKSAEASLLKMKEIVDAEDAFSEDEKEQANAWATVTNAADDESDVDVSELKDHDVVAEEQLPVVVPGFRLWDTKSKLASKDGLTQVSKVSLWSGVTFRFIANSYSMMKERTSTRTS